MENQIDITKQYLDEIGELREKLASAYVELSGKTNHSSDCATSNSPAMTPGKCDCFIDIPQSEIRKPYVYASLNLDTVKEMKQSEIIGERHD